MLFQRFANAVLRSLFLVFLDYEVEGLGNLPQVGPLVTVQNHMVFLDTVVAAAFIDREVVGMSKAENYRNPFLGLLFRLYGTFPVRRGEVDRTALRTSLRVLKEGKVLMAAPEGTRSKSNTLQKGKDGLTYIAVTAAAPVVPVAIWGQEKFWQRLRKLRRTKVKMVMGRPFVFEPGDSFPSLANRVRAWRIAFDAGESSPRQASRRLGGRSVGLSILAQTSVGLGRPVECFDSSCGGRWPDCCNRANNLCQFRSATRARVSESRSPSSGPMVGWARSWRMRAAVLVSNTAARVSCTWP